MDAFEIQHLNKSFPVDKTDIQILFDISCHIRLGEMTMIVGPSGCGKTTFISILSGILSSDSGHIKILGKPLEKMSGGEKVKFRRKHIGFIFQQYHLLPTLSVLENVSIPLIAAGVGEKKAQAQAKQALIDVEMGDHITKYPRQLSGGQQQRVAIARALVHAPDIIICDEPTAALDAKTGQAVMALLRKVANDTNRAVIIVTHDNRIYHFANRILEMSDGRIIGDHLPQHFHHE